MNKEIDDAMSFHFLERKDKKLMKATMNEN